MARICDRTWVKQLRTAAAPPNADHTGYGPETNMSSKQSLHPEGVAVQCGGGERVVSHTAEVTQALGVRYREGLFRGWGTRKAVSLQK